MAEAPQPIHPTIRMHRGLEHRGRPHKPDGTWVMDLEDATRQATAGVIKHHEAISNSIGERAYGEKKVSEAKQVRRYAVMKDDDNQWANLIETFGLQKAIDYALRLEKLSQKYPDDYKYGQTAAQGKNFRERLNTATNGQQ